MGTYRRTDGNHSGTYERVQTFDVRGYGTVDTTGTNDSSDAVTAAIAAAYAAGGGVVEFPVGTIRIDDQITMPNDGATPAKQPTIMLRGKGCHWSGRGTAIVGGTVLDLRYDGTQGKVRTNGLGLLVVEHLTFTDEDGTDTPFLYTTNTTLHVRDCGFMGTKNGELCDQDAIICGGTTATEGGNGWDDGFQGYGTVIQNNYFNKIRRAVYGRVFFNANVVRDNTVWSGAGSNLVGGACFELDGDTTNVTSGNVFTGNLIEMTNYPYGFKVADAQRNTFAFNQFYDPDAGTSLAAFRFETTGKENLVLMGFKAGTLTAVSDASTDGTAPTNTVVAAEQGQTSYFRQGTHFTNKDIDTEIRRAKFIGGDTKTTVQPAEATGTESATLFRILRSAAEATNPSASIFAVQQNGTITVRGANAGNVNFQDADGNNYTQFTNAGRKWVGTGTGGAMEINTGTGGSTFTLRAINMRMYDHAGVEKWGFGSGGTLKLWDTGTSTLKTGTLTNNVLSWT